jgi:two-component sensor histidine kinase
VYRHGSSLAATDQGPDAGLLGGLGAASALILPLAYGTKRVGGIFLLDLLDDETLQKAMDTLKRLSSILALVLRNADLYGHLEDEVAERTALLERRKLELEALLKEVHHRVKNNLQIVLSLLYLKSSSTSSKEARSILQESQDSIFAMAQVHEEIYRTGDFSGIDMADYLPRVADQMIAAANLRITMQYRLESLRLDLGVAIPCGLIVSELVTNSIKYAFSSRKEGTLTVETGMLGGEAFIRIADDGPGFPASPATDRRPGVGMDIVRSLVDQVGGRMIREPGPGASILLLFKPR